MCCVFVAVLYLLVFPISLVLKYIQELADYEQMSDGPKIDVDRLRDDGFGKEKFFRCFVADAGDKLVGYSLYFFSYSTWEGISMFLEDLYVNPEYRNLGLGIGLWKKVAEVAVAKKCKRLDWVCLCWNKTSIAFYKSKGAVNVTDKDGWDIYRLTGDNLKQFAA